MTTAPPTLATAVYQQLATEPGNLAFSSLSVATALSMLRRGPRRNRR